MFTRRFCVRSYFPNEKVSLSTWELLELQPDYVYKVPLVLPFTWVLNGLKFITNQRQRCWCPVEIHEGYWWSWAFYYIPTLTVNRDNSMPFQGLKSSHNFNRLIYKILLELCCWHIYIFFDLIFIVLAFRIWLLSAPKKRLIANGYYSDICVKINYKLHLKVISFRPLLTSTIPRLFNSLPLSSYHWVLLPAFAQP